MDFGDLRGASAVCTHPYYTGRNTAPVLVRQVMLETLEEGVTPLLHVGSRNARANGLYEALGLCACANCGMRSLSYRAKWNVRLAPFRACPPKGADPRRLVCRY